MKRMMRALGALAMLLGLALPAQASTDEQQAYETVKTTTDRVLALINEAKGYHAQDPQRFYREVDTILADVADFPGFARSVMGRHASVQVMNSLDEAGKAKLQGQIERFTSRFRQGLVTTYAEGLLSFNGQRIEVQVPRGASEDRSSVDVTQLIFGDAPNPYVVQYRMRKDDNGAWKLRNVTIEAVNLGKVYRSQFDEAVRKHRGDLDKVIDTWSVEPAEAVAKVQDKNGAGS